MGSNLACGHYVAHVKQPDGRWVLFNDQKVRARGARAGRAAPRRATRRATAEAARRVCGWQCGWGSQSLAPRSLCSLRACPPIVRRMRAPPSALRRVCVAQVALSEATPLDQGYVYLYRRL